MPWGASPPSYFTQLSHWPLLLGSIRLSWSSLDKAPEESSEMTHWPTVLEAKVQQSADVFPSMYCEDAFPVPVSWELFLYCSLQCSFIYIHIASTLTPYSQHSLFLAVSASN